MLPPLQQGSPSASSRAIPARPELLEHLIVEKRGTPRVVGGTTAPHHGRRPRENYAAQQIQQRHERSDTPYLLPPPLPRAAICMALRIFGREATDQGLRVMSRGAPRMMNMRRLHTGEGDPARPRSSGVTPELPIPTGWVDVSCLLAYFRIISPYLRG